MKKLLVALLISAVVISGLNCAATQSQQGAGIGAVVGGVVGGVIGHQMGDKTAGIILGAALGGLAGAYIGDYMDKQAKEINQQVPDADVIVINNEGKPVENSQDQGGQAILVKFDSNTLFDVNSSELKAGAKSNLDNLAGIMTKYEKTNIHISGHTDATGTDDLNQKLSEKRAQAVSGYLTGKGVTATRFTVVGHGESKPIASNDTPEGRQLNRRVEIIISPNDALVDTAKKQG